MKLYKHTPQQCKEVLKSVQDLVKQIDRNPNKEVRQALCEAASEMCDRLLRDGEKV
jgi:Txe/YoeB family toxin of Txe-Axe toxin-antitoxin module